MNLKEPNHDSDQKINTKPTRQQEEWAKAKEKYQEVKAWLEATYPKAFNFNNPVPLKCGIKKDLLAAPSPYNKYELTNALHAYIKRFKYLKALAKGEYRYDLNGEITEQISQEHKDHASRQIQKKIAGYKSTQNNLIEGK